MTGSIVVAETNCAFGQPLPADSAADHYSDSGAAPWPAGPIAIGSTQKRDT